MIYVKGTGHTNDVTHIVQSPLFLSNVNTFCTIAVYVFAFYVVRCGLQQVLSAQYLRMFVLRYKMRCQGTFRQKLQVLG